ncbi:hypothetical protein [Streptomyces sp. ISL-100]|uniref:hypothetical protein n=1 Tax=Streptomyces sp. ISL-100 TaxID=2819173 RepID=UPI001BE92954|nr:hypothetical protein [Streptomyces sp. ISL-100]MBT2396269.1 hypothetical protein [Streptomyces sp. ISL-100]
MTQWTPKLTNVDGTDGTSGSGHYVSAGGACTFTAMIVAHKETTSRDGAGFGLTLPVPAKSGARLTFQLSYDGRDADHGVWTGEALIYAGSDGKQIDRLRVTGTSNGAALQNVNHVYGDVEGAKEAEIITVTGSYPVA